MPRHLTLVVASLVALAAAARAQIRDGAARAQLRDGGARVERIAENVSVIIHDDALRTWPVGGTDWPHGNTGVIVGDAAVLVVDATFLPSRARADIALIRRLTRLPVRYLVNTHWHGDHTHGNSVYRDSFPDISILSSRANRDLIAINQARFKARVASPDHGSRAAIVQHEALLARGADSTGRTLTPDERRVRLDDLRGRFNPAGSASLDEMWTASIVNALIPRSFSCLQGVTC